MDVSINKILDALVNKFHIILGSIVQGAIIAYHFKTHIDLGPMVTNTIYAFYAFLGGHALTYQLHPDKDKDSQ